MTYDQNTISFAPLPNHWRFQNLTGQVFHRWTVIGFAGTERRRKSYWWCQCECGKLGKVEATNLKQNQSRSCGCWNLEQLHKTIHGETAGDLVSPEYTAYQHAKRRCEDINGEYYHHYGGRGIQFLFDSFQEFLAEVGRRPSPKHSIDRKDNDGHYEPGNIQWATRTEQNRNTRKNRLITYNGETRAISEWCEKLKLNYSTVYRRVGRGWPIDRVFEQPFRRSPSSVNV